MDIAKLDQGAWLEANSVDENVGTLKLKIRFMEVLKAEELRRFVAEITKDEDIDAETEEKNFHSMIKRLSDYIVDWNLTSNGRDLECSEENKKTYLPKLLRFRVKRTDKEGKETTVILAMEVITFSQKVENFLKN